MLGPNIAGPDKSKQSRAGQSRAGQILTGQIRTGQSRPGQIRSGQSHPRTASKPNLWSLSYYLFAHHTENKRRKKVISKGLAKITWVVK